MKVLVTGCAGFIGSNVTDYLLKVGHRVVGVDNFNNFYSPKIKRYNLKEFEANPDFELYEFDLLNQSKLKQLFDDEQIDAVVHLAAHAGVTQSLDDPVGTVQNNIEVTATLLEECRLRKVNNFIFASTSVVYGSNKPPFTEDMRTDDPFSPYPASKKAGEVIAYSYAHNYDINITIFRIFNPMGIRMRPDMALTLLIRSCLYGTPFNMRWTWEEAANCARDYFSVNHLCQAVETVLQKPFKYEIFNIGNSQLIPLKEFIETVQEVTGKKANVVVVPGSKGEMVLNYSNIDKAKRMINFNPTTSVKKIVEDYFDWFQKQEEWYKRGEY